MAPSPSRDRPPAVRRAGVLLHATALPSPYGIGDIGPEARRFVAWLADAGQSIWQMLPVNPTDDHGSPYASPSAFARNPLLLSIDDLIEDGWLDASHRYVAHADERFVNHADVRRQKGPLLDEAAARVARDIDLDAWSAQHSWVRNWAVFAALCETHGGAWTRWPAPLRDRDPDALRRATEAHRLAIDRHLALQWLFDQQWKRLRRTAKAHGISLWGDVPFFVGGESCDVWVHRELFRLGADGLPTVVSGVPPDVFSADGQKWGTPLYDARAHADEGFDWWCRRLAATFELFDEVRLDHFRGIAGVWEIPADQPATEGRWIDSLGAPMLTAVRERLGELPLIAEDLGIITPDVIALRDGFDLPGMVILQFAFADMRSDGTHAYLPHNHRPRQVVYPGTHDNDTTVGWYEAVDEQTRDHMRRYLSSDGSDPAGDLLRSAYRSVAADAVVALQDTLRFGTWARTNVPGKAEGNWGWRTVHGDLSGDLASWLAYEARMCGRSGG